MDISAYADAFHNLLAADHVSLQDMQVEGQLELAGVLQLDSNHQAKAAHLRHTAAAYKAD